MKYAVILRFNGRVSGKSVLSDTFEADSVGDALGLATAAAVRSKRGGGAIYVTGLHVEEVPE